MDIGKDDSTPQTGIIPKYLVWTGWGHVIFRLREFIGMDQAMFGLLIGGYTQGQISRYEIQKTEPPIDFWIKLMLMFSLNISWVMTGMGVPYMEITPESDERSRLNRWLTLQKNKAAFMREIEINAN